MISKRVSKVAEFVINECILINQNQKIKRKFTIYDSVPDVLKKVDQDMGEFEFLPEPAGLYTGEKRWHKLCENEGEFA